MFVVFSFHLGFFRPYGVCKDIEPSNPGLTPLSYWSIAPFGAIRLSDNPLYEPDSTILLSPGRATTNSPVA